MIKLTLLLLSLSLNFTKKNGVILFFFDAECPYCHKEMSEIVKLQQEGYDVLGITNTSSMSNKYPFPVKLDEGEADYVGVQAVPTIALLFVKQRKLFVLSEGYTPAQGIINRIKLLKWPED